MSVRFILGRCGSGKSTYILESIKNRVQDDEKTPVILLVPEQYTFEAEKKLSSLFEGDLKDKYLRTRVLSFKTLSDIVSSRVGGLTDVKINKSGINMMAYKAIDRVKEKLKVFSINQSGIVESIVDIISELKQYNIDANNIKEIIKNTENETLKLKLEDIYNVYKDFDELLHENYVDSQDILNSLSINLKSSSYLKDAYVYIDEFTGFTPKQYKVLSSILSEAREVFISLTVDKFSDINYVKTDPFSRTKFTYSKIVSLCQMENIKIEKESVVLNKNYRFKNNNELIHLEKNYHSYPYKIYEKDTNYIKIKEFNNLYQEIEEIAKEIIILVREKNIRYKDITIATRDLNRYDFLIRSIFNEYEIPHFIDKKKEAKSNPIIVLIVSLLDMKNRNYNYETMFRYLKSGLIGISNDEVSILENYVIENGIRGKKWFEETWNYGNYSDEYLQKINDIKYKIITPIINFNEKLKLNKKVIDICTSIYEFLVEINIYETIQNLIKDFREKGDLDIASQYAQVFDIVIDILDQMVEIMGDEKISFEKFIKVISLGFDSYELSIVPPSIDEVLVSSIDRMKNPNTKYLYLIGTIDGVFPLVSKENSLLNDSDRENLNKIGVEVDIDTKTKTFEEQFLVYKALTSSSENLIISYPISDHEGKSIRPSIIVSRIKKIFKNITIESYLLEDKNKSSLDILNSLTSKKSVFNQLIGELKNYNDETDKIWLDIYRYFLDDDYYSEYTKKIEKSLDYTNMVSDIDENKIKKLYDKKALSVSKIESYVKCPFSYFIKYGLEAKERKEYNFTSLDLGNFTHKIIETFSINLEKDSEKTWQNIDEKYIEKEVSKIIDEIIKKTPGFILNSSYKYKYLSDRIKNMIVFVINILAKQIQAGEFNPVEYEVEFSKKGTYDSIKIDSDNDEKIELVGKIDRVDKCETENYIRVVDYKSSKKSISLKDVYNGHNLQLLVYLDTILTNLKDKNYLPAGIFYSPVDEVMLKAKNIKDKEDLQKQLMNELKMNGLIIKDMDIVEKMDRNFLDKGTSNIIPAKKSSKGFDSKTTKGVTLEEFDILREYIKILIKDIHTNIFKGNIKINPYKSSNVNNACSYCEYSSICLFDENLEDNNYNIIKSKCRDSEIIEDMKKVIECGQVNNKE